MNKIYFIIDLQGETVMFFSMSTEKSYYLSIETWEKYKEGFSSEDPVIRDITLDILKNKSYNRMLWR
jgi:hypothetical protein